MRERMKAAKFLAAITTTAQIVLVFAGRGPTGQVPTAMNVNNSDWTTFGKAVAAIPAILRRASKRDAGLHSLHHFGKNNQDLYIFWKEINERL